MLVEIVSSWTFVGMITPPEMPKLLERNKSENLFLDVFG